MFAQNNQIKRPVAECKMRSSVEIGSYPVAICRQKQLHVICDRIPVAKPDTLSEQQRQLRLPLLPINVTPLPAAAHVRCVL
jgi:hypothetical protein